MQYTISGYVSQLMKHPDLFAHFHTRDIDEYLTVEKIKEMSAQEIQIRANKAKAHFADKQSANALFEAMQNRGIHALRNYFND